jgi:hypothetical protein
MATTYQLGSLVSYASSYLANWVGVTYQVELGDASLDARQQAVPLAREQVMRGQEKQVINLTINPANMMVESFKLLLLPVWLVRYTSAEKSFTILINGQTGVIRDERTVNRGEALLKKILGAD